MLVEGNSKPRDIATYTDGSVTRDQSCWGLTVKLGGRTVHEDSGTRRAGVNGNKCADRMASTADTTAGLQLGRREVLRGLGNFLNMDRLEHHRMDHQDEREVKKGSGWHSTIRGRERSLFNQTNIGTVSRVTLGRLLRDGAERAWAFPSATTPSWANIDTETDLTLHLAWRHTFFRASGQCWGCKRTLCMVCKVTLSTAEVMSMPSMNDCSVYSWSYSYA